MTRPLVALPVLAPRRIDFTRATTAGHASPMATVTVAPRGPRRIVEVPGTPATSVLSTWRNVPAGTLAVDVPPTRGNRKATKTARATVAGRPMPTALCAAALPGFRLRRQDARVLVRIGLLASGADMGTASRPRSVPRKTVQHDSGSYSQNSA